MASYGYAVIVPDALNHGQRGLIDYDDKQAYPLFWQTVLQSTQEAGALIAYGEAHWPEQKIFVAGHSMGWYYGSRSCCGTKEGMRGRILERVGVVE